MPGTGLSTRERVAAGAETLPSRLYSPEAGRYTNQLLKQ